MSRTPQHAAWVLLIAASVFVLGCNQSDEAGKNSEMGSVAKAMKSPPPPAPTAAPAPAAQPAARSADPTPPPQPAATPAATPTAPPAEQGQIEVVTAHSPKRGQSLEGGGYLSVVTGTRFWAENQITLDVIRHNMDLYKGEHGEYPKTQEIFMREVINANLVKLPELPAGWDYYYDPQEPLVLKMRNTGSGDPQAVE